MSYVQGPPRRLSLLRLESIIVQAKAIATPLVFILQGVATAEPNRLRDHYNRAFEKATELRLLTAFLTKWEVPALNTACKRLRVLVGEDFGITRLSAVKRLQDWQIRRPDKWLKAANAGTVFHPKVLLWKEVEKGSTTYHLVLGSSNQTDAAFGSNVEANIYLTLTPAQYQEVSHWADVLFGHGQDIDDEWFKRYKECTFAPKAKSGKGSLPGSNGAESEGVVLPEVDDLADVIGRRKAVRDEFLKHESLLKEKIEECARGKLSKRNNLRFYDDLRKVWKPGTSQIQAPGWERIGKSGNFKMLCEALQDVFAAADRDARDSVVAHWMTKLKVKKSKLWKACFSELLCQFFPEDYPLWNSPVDNWVIPLLGERLARKDVGAAYVQLARTLRASLVRDSSNQKAPRITDLAYLDAVLWDWQSGGVH